jgi:hypothetical protein
MTVQLGVVENHRIRAKVAMALVLVLSFLVGNSNYACGQTPLSTRARLADTLEHLRQSMDSSRIPQVPDAIRQVKAAYGEVSKHLSRTSDAENAAKWMEYLGFETFQQAVAEDASPAVLGKFARSTYWRMSRNLPGLELPSIVALRESLQKLTDAALYRDSDRTVESIDKQLEQLAKIVREGGEVLSADDAAKVNRLLHFVETSDLAPRASQELQAVYGLPNVRVLAGQSLLNHWLTRPVNRTTPSDECILGTRVLSSVTLQGHFTARLQPDNNNARLLLSMNADAHSLGTGYQKSVRVKNRSYGDANVSRSLTIGNNGLQPGGVTADAHLNSEILGVEHRLKIVRKIGARRAQQLQPQATAIATERFEQRLAREFQQETDSRLFGGSANGGLLASSSQAPTVLRRLDLAPPAKHWSSSNDYLQVGLTVKNAFQTTTNLAPPVVPGGYYIAFQIQESAIDNTASSLLADRTLRDSEIVSFAKALLPQTGRLAEKLNAPTQSTPQDDSSDENIQGDETQNEPLSIEFSGLRPIIFEARNGKLRVGIRGARFEQGPRVLNRSLEITATYVSAQKADGSFLLLREGEVEVNFPGGPGRRLSIPEVALRGNIEKRFAKVFPNTLLDRAFEIPSSQGQGTSASLWVSPRQISLENGWLTVSL